MLFRVFGSQPASVLQALTTQHLCAVYYHVVGDEVPHIKHLFRCKTAAAFEEDLEHLLRKYNPVGVTDVIEHVRQGRRLPAHACLLTFDDGYREIDDVVAPLLVRRGVPAIFFVNTAFMDNASMCYLNVASLLLDRLGRTAWSEGLAQQIEGIVGRRVEGPLDARAYILSVRYADRSRLDVLAAVLGVDVAAYLEAERPYLSSAQIDGLVRLGFGIGAHSIDHPWYALLPLEEQLRQTTESARTVRTRFRLNYGAFAFPHSDVNVGMAFFARLAETGLVDVSFGTGGLLDDSVPSHFQRVSLERPLVPAERILRFHHARRLTRVLTGRARVARL